MAASYTTLGDFILKQLLGFATLNKIKANVTYLKENLIEAGWPSGVKTLFYQNTAPLGWVIDQAPDGNMVYVTKGSGAGGRTGGTLSAGSHTQFDGALDAVVTLNVTPTYSGTVHGPDPGNNNLITHITAVAGISNFSAVKNTLDVNVPANYLPKSANCIVCTKSAYP